MSKMIPLLLGEKQKDGITKGNPVIAGDCIWCDDPVWSSDIAYTTDDPGGIYKIKDLKVKPMHKMCLINLMQTGKEVMIAMGMNLKKRGYDIKP